MSYDIIPLPFFERQLKRLVKKYPSIRQEYATLIALLENDPEQGTALGNDCYKIRLAIASKGKGKSGGARIVTLVVHNNESVYLLSIYDKSEQENITDKELQALVKAAKAL
ncbi:MAG: type II toxin-antitoxin system RelE/ParE family toxin [Chitinophagaceae bacterium]|nr:type II toxin-antitoxin system RelE/ParE family toxin [Chitinophagaceae bacterium]